MRPAASPGGAVNRGANAAAASTGGGDGTGFPALPDPGEVMLPPAPPDDLPVLKLLQQGDLFGPGRGAAASTAGGSSVGFRNGEEVPLLIPLVNGAVTNINFDESYGQPQEALIERYLTLMGLAPQLAAAAEAAAAPQPPGTAAAADGGGGGTGAKESAAGAAATTGYGSWVGGKRAAAAGPIRSHAAAGPVNAAAAAAAAAPLASADPRQGEREVNEAAAHDTDADADSEAADDDDLLLSVQRPRRRPPPPPSPGTTPAITALGLDRLTLHRRGIPEALIGALHRGLAATASAFFRTCLAEQRRLVALTHGSGPEVPLADRLLSFITGTEAQLKNGSSTPELVDLRAVRDNQAILDAVSPPRPGDPIPFYHELLHKRQQQQEQEQDQKQGQPKQSSSSAPPGPSAIWPTVGEVQMEGEGEGGLETAPLEQLLDLDKVAALATAGNVPGLRALLRSLVAAADYTRTSLLARLRAEVERAQREGERAAEAKKAENKLREQLAARNVALAERGVELEAACRRATAAEEALVTERAIVSGLRGQLRQLTADYEAQHRELRAGLEAHLTRPASAKLLQGSHNNSHSSSSSSSSSHHRHHGHHGHRHGHHAPAAATAASNANADDAAELHALGSELATARAELALSEMTCQQERAKGRQLKVMLDTARGTVDMHASRAAAAAAEVERLGRLVAASEDLANASSGGMAMLEQQLAQEKAAHRRTLERLQATSWKVEQARTAVVDVRARAGHNLRKLQTALADVNLRAVSAERQLADATVELRHTRSELEGANNSLEALRDRTTRLEEDMALLRTDAVTAKVDVKELSEKLRETEVALSNASARVTQMQQKIMDDADTVLAGRRASQRLSVLEKEHEELQTTHRALQDSHAQLGEQHRALQDDMALAREKIEELEVKEARLKELTVQHEELKTAKARLDQQYAGMVKAKSLLSSELAGLKRHADVLADQVHEYRRLADGARLALEEEKEALRHTKEELAMTATKRDELEVKCADLSSILEGMDVRMKAADAEVQRCRRVAELAGHQRAEAFAMRDAMMKVRITLTCEVKEYLAGIEGQVRQMGKRLDELKSTLTLVQSRLLDMDSVNLEGTTAELPKVPYEESQKMVTALFDTVSLATQILETQSRVRQALVERIDHLEDGIKDRLGTATDYWRQVLILSRGTPRSMVQMVEHMTGQACRELDLDPANPLARMVPLGVLEEAGLQLNTQYERVGWLRDRADESKAKGDAANKLLEHERQVTAARTAEYQSLIDTLSGEVHKLKRRVSSLEANNAMQQRATADMQRLLNDAEWKVTKAKEREAMLGVRFIVPHGRDNKAVQTVYSDLYMMTGPIAPTITIISSAAAAAAAAAPRQQLLLQTRSLGMQEPAPSADTGELLGCTEDGVEYGSSGGGVMEVPGSPASLPPLSALNSPTINSAAAGGGGGSAAANHWGSTSLRNRPQSNLSRGSSALPPAASPMRCTSPDLPNAGPDGAADGGGGGGGGPPLPRPTCVSPDMPLGRSPSTSASGNGGAAAFTGQGRPPPSQRRRHPDEVQRRSAGSALSPAASLNSLHSANSVLSDSALGSGGGSGGYAAAAASYGGSGGAANNGGALTERGYTSDGGDGGGGAPVTAASNSDDDEYPPASPPMVLHTPSGAATAANAAAFTAAANSKAIVSASCGGASPYNHHHHHHHHNNNLSRPATAGAPSSTWVQAVGPGSAHVVTGQHPHHPHHHAVRLSGAVLHSSRPASPVVMPVAIATPQTPSGIPHGWQHSPWDWVPDAAPLARSGAVQPYGRQALLEVIADIHYTKGLHDQVAAAASFPATSMLQYIGAYFEARHGPRGSSPPAAELALGQLLASLEAHSALYDVMLFARVAGLQAWTCKGVCRNGSSSNAASRPATAQSLKMSAAGGSFSRPRTPRDANMSPYASGGLSPSRPGTAASVAAAARNNRTLSARNSMGTPPMLLGLVPSSRPSTAASPPMAYGAASGTVAVDVSDLVLPVNGGETVMRVRTGLSPTITTSAATATSAAVSSANAHHGSAHALHTGSRRAGSTAGPLVSAPPPAPLQQQQQPPPSPTQQKQQQLQQLQQQQQQQPKPHLKIRPEILVSEHLSQLLSQLSDVSGMDALSQFINTGRLLGKLKQTDLGQPLQEELHPELHFTVRQVCDSLRIEEAPELLIRPTLPYGADLMLLQVPYVATGSLAVLAQGDVDRQPVLYPLAASSAAAGGWRRRGVLLLTPAFVAVAEPAILRESEAPLIGDELRAMLGAALAPLAMPGGTGWRLEVQGAPPNTQSATTAGGGSGGGSSGGAIGNSGGVVAPRTSGSGAPPGFPPPSSPTLLSAAEAITVVNAAALKGRSVASVLPSQLQFKWDRMLAHLRTVAAAATVSADRGALLATQNMAAAVRAVFRAAAGLGLQDGAQPGSSEDLLLQAQTMPVSDENMMCMATVPIHEAAAEGGDSRRGYALARVAMLARWAEAPEYRQLLRSSVM